MEKITGRVWLLEMKTKKQTEADVEAQRRAAYSRLMQQLRTVLPDDPPKYELSNNGFSKRVILDRNDRSHHHKLSALNARILCGTQTADDRSVLASLPLSDLAMTDQTAEQLVAVACMILDAY